MCILLFQRDPWWAVQGVQLCPKLLQTILEQLPQSRRHSWRTFPQWKFSHPSDPWRPCARRVPEGCKAGRRQHLWRKCRKVQTKNGFWRRSSKNRSRSTSWHWRPDTWDSSWYSMWRCCGPGAWQRYRTWRSLRSKPPTKGWQMFFCFLNENPSVDMIIDFFIIFNAILHSKKLGKLMKLCFVIKLVFLEFPIFIFLFIFLFNLNQLNTFSIDKK